MEKRRKLLRQLLSGEKTILAPGAHNCVAAKIIEKVGFQAIYATGFGASANMLGYPDVGLMTLTEMVNHIRNLVNATSLPVIADADTGYGNAVNVMRTVQEYEKAGVAAIQLEDQIMPKKCGHMLGRELVPMKDMVGKIKAARSARKDSDLIIIARTDARTNYGIEEAIRRGKAYANAGADLIFVESPESIEEMKLINESINIPTLANMIENGRTPLLSLSELEKLGFRLVIFPVTGILAEAHVLFNVYKKMMETGSTNDLIGSLLLDFNKFNELMGVADIKELEKQFLPPDIIE